MAKEDCEKLPPDISSESEFQRPKSCERILAVFLARFVKNKLEISDILNYRIGVEVVTEKNQNYNEIILPILTYIQSQLEESLSLEHLSQKTGLPYYFHRMFQDAVGESLKNYTT